MSENNYLKKLIKPKKEGEKSPLEKFINKEDITVKPKSNSDNKANVVIEHYGNAPKPNSSDISINSTENQPIQPNEVPKPKATDALLKANGIREFDIDSLDIDSPSQVTVKPESSNENTKNAGKTISITSDEINTLIGFVKSGNFDAAVDFIVQLKLKYNIDNIL